MCKSECSDKLRAQICILSLGGPQHWFFPPRGQVVACPDHLPPVENAASTSHCSAIALGGRTWGHGGDQPSRKKDRIARPASLRDGKGKTSICHVAGRAESVRAAAQWACCRPGPWCPLPWKQGVRRLWTTRCSPAAFCLFG